MRILGLSNRLETTWLYFNHNQKTTHNFTNFKLNYLKSFKIKTLLNELPTYFHFYKIYAHIFYNTNCFHCSLPDSPTHWRLCSNSSLISNLIQTSISEHINQADLNLSKNQQKELICKISNHYAFNFLFPQSNLYHLDITLKGLIPKSLIDTVQSFNILYKLASQTIIAILLKVNKLFYEQIWKPYCINFANWKQKQRLIPPYFRPLTQQNQNNRRISNHKNYTYSCLCGLPDQIHSNSSTCPPIGYAIRKINR